MCINLAVRKPADFKISAASTALHCPASATIPIRWTQMRAIAARLGVNLVNTFIGRDPLRSVEDNWPLFRAVWPDIVRHAESRGVRIGLENCPMLFSKDEWPGGKNLAVSPAIWNAVFREIPSPNLGLNYDPSHLIWLHIDPVRCIRDFGSRIVHV